MQVPCEWKPTRELGFSSLNSIDKMLNDSEYSASIPDDWVTCMCHICKGNRVPLNKRRLHRRVFGDTEVVQTAGVQVVRSLFILQSVSKDLSSSLLN